METKQSWKLRYRVIGYQMFMRGINVDSGTLYCLYIDISFNWKILLIIIERYDTFACSHNGTLYRWILIYLLQIDRD